jgi:hypothetical protein
MDEYFVYFLQIGENGPIKIGWTSRPPYRVREHCSEHPHETIRFLGKVPDNKYRERERRLHKTFQKDMIVPEEVPEGIEAPKKSEIFRPSESLLGYISRLEDKSLS